MICPIQKYTFVLLAALTAQHCSSQMGQNSQITSAVMPPDEQPSSIDLPVYIQGLGCLHRQPIARYSANENSLRIVFRDTSDSRDQREIDVALEWTSDDIIAKYPCLISVDLPQTLLTDIGPPALKTTTNVSEFSLTIVSNVKNGAELKIESRFLDNPAPWMVSETHNLGTAHLQYPNSIQIDTSNKLISGRGHYTLQFRFSPQIINSRDQTIGLIDQNHHSALQIFAIEAKLTQVATRLPSRK